MIHKDNWGQYKIDYKVSSIKAFDEKASKDCLDVTDSVTKKITRYYYEFVEQEYLREMPQDKLEDLKAKVDEVLKQRALSPACS